MKSPIPFLSFTLLAQFGVCHVATSNELPKINVTRVGTVGAMLLLTSQGKGYKYAPSDGSYSIKFPGKPTESTQNVQTPIGPIKVLLASYSANQGKRAYFSSSTRYKINPKQYNVEKGLDGARDGIVKSANATISNETKIKYKGASGRQFFLTMQQGKAKVRIYVVNAGKGPTIYQSFVMDTTGKIEDGEVNSFLDSLAFSPR